MTSKAATIPQCIIIYSENYTKCVDTLTPKELECRLPRAVLSMRIKVPGVVLNTSSGWNQPGRNQSSLHWEAPLYHRCHHHSRIISCLRVYANERQLHRRQEGRVPSACLHENPEQKQTWRSCVFYFLVSKRVQRHPVLGKQCFLESISWAAHGQISNLGLQDIQTESIMVFLLICLAL